MTTAPYVPPTTTPLLDRFYPPRHVLDDLPTEEQPTERQLRFLFDLARNRVWKSLGSDVVQRTNSLADHLEAQRPGRTVVSHWIDVLLAAPRDDDAGHDEARSPVEHGVYELDGEVYLVKFNRGKTARYVQRLVETSPRLTEAGTVIDFDYVYAPGMLSRLRPEHRMTLDRARHFLTRYGRCLRCHRTIKVASSVERGLGLVCVRYFA